MKYPKQAKKKSKLALIIGVLVICLAQIGIAAWFLGAETEKDGAVEVELETAKIQTPYTTIHLEGDWVSALRYKVNRGDVTELLFSSKIAGENVRLFDLYLGSEENLAGYLTADSGEKVPVGIVVHDIVPAENWSEEEEEQAYAMQDVLNEILSQLDMEAAFMDSVEDAAEVSVETSVGVFTYMDYWNGGLQIVDENGCISGFGTVSGKPEQKLFDISIGGTGEITAGMYTDEEGQEIPVFLTVPDLAFDEDWTEQEQSDIYGMQNVLNDILGQLDLTAVEQPMETEAAFDDVSVTTSYGTIAYPGEYDGKLRISLENANGYYIRAYATMPEKAEIHLFDVMIGGAGDVFAGTVTDSSGKSKEVYLNVSDLNLEDSWTKEARNDVYVMQTLLNDFCEQLGVTVDPETEETTTESDVVVEMPYGKLCYPGEYRQYLATEVTRDNGRTVIFYTKRNTGEKIRLFDLIIGGSGDAYVGTLTTVEGTVLEVYVTSYEITPGDGWSDAEKQIVYGMQEAVNYVLDKMEEKGMLIP